MTRCDRTKLVDAGLKEVDTVHDTVGEVGLGALCFLEADWPVIGGAFTTCRVHVTWPERLANRLGDHDGDADAVAASLAERCPSA